MKVIDSAEARRAKRQGVVLDMGLIRIGEISVSCVVCNISEAGAALEMGPQSGIPDQFAFIVVPKKNLFLQYRVAQEPAHWRVISLIDATLED